MSYFLSTIICDCHCFNCWLGFGEDVGLYTKYNFWNIPCTLMVFIIIPFVKNNILTIWKKYVCLLLYHNVRPCHLPYQSNICHTHNGPLYLLMKLHLCWPDLFLPSSIPTGKIELYEFNFLQPRSWQPTWSSKRPPTY